MLYNYRNVDQRKMYELDIYVPSLSLGFEYQGEHHYEDHFLFGAHQLRKGMVI